MAILTLLEKELTNRIFNFLGLTKSKLLDLRKANKGYVAEIENASDGITKLLFQMSLNGMLITTESGENWYKSLMAQRFDPNTLVSIQNGLEVR